MISVRQFGTLLLLLSAIALLQPPCNSLTFTASGHVQDFHPIDIEHAEHTKKRYDSNNHNVFSIMEDGGTPVK